MSWEKKEQYKKTIIKCLIKFCENRDNIFNKTKENLQDLHYDILANLKDNFKKEWKKIKKT